MRSWLDEKRIERNVDYPDKWGFVYFDSMKRGLKGSTTIVTLSETPNSGFDEKRIER